MDLGKYNNMVKDFQNLISCIKCHEDITNIPVIIETLRTITDICINEECGKDAFREEGGLDFLSELISTTDSTTLLEHLLKTLAFVIDENVHSQMHMTKKENFLVLQAIIKKPAFPPAILKHTLLLTSSILFQNSLAQSLMSEIGFLQDIIKLFEQTASFYICSNFSNPVLNDSSVHILISVNSVLCFAVNNPQNERNQETCSVLFPLLLKLFELSSDVAISGSLLSFLSLCVASNVKSQQKFAEADGLLTIKRSFQKYYDLAVLDATEFHGVVSKSTAQSLINLIGVITAVANENDKNAEILGKLGVLTLMMKLLIARYLDDKLKTRLILALAYCIDAHNNLFESDSMQNEQIFPSVSDKDSVSDFQTNKLPTKKSVGGDSVKSPKGEFLINTLDHINFIQPYQTVDQSRPTEYVTNKKNKNICDTKRDLENLEPNLQMSPSPYKTSKNDEAEYCPKSHITRTSSVKSYQNRKKENILLINSHLCSLPKHRKKKIDSQRVFSEQSSLVFSDSDASCLNKHDNNKQFNIPSPKQSKYANVFLRDYSDSKKDFKNFSPFSNEVNFDQENKSILSRNNFSWNPKSIENIGDSKENSIINERNATKYNTKSSYEVRESYANSEMKNSSCTSRKAVFPGKALWDPVVFPSPNFLKIFDAGLPTSSSQTDLYPRQHKKRKRITSASSHVERDINSSSPNEDLDQVIGNNVQVIVLPSDEACEQHKLLVSFEYLKVKPLKDAILTMD